MRFFKALSVIVALLFILPVQAKRVALVIGNDNYTVVSKLQKAGNDATAMARELKAAGFTVQLHRDLNYLGMVKAVESFTKGIAGGDEVVVFFAGHGVQIKNGSYLIPTDIEANSESQVEKTAYELLALTDKISEAKPAFSLILVDACRDNPLKSQGRTIGNARGLSAIEPPKGQIVVYSASRGQQALDRLGENDPNPNGVFTREFIARMKKPGIKIEDLMREVQDSVEALAKTISHEQRPAVYNEARGNFYFFSPTTVQAMPNNSEEQKDEKFWEDAKAVGNKEAFEAYIKSYPKGKFLDLAKAYISRLTNINSSEIQTKPIPSSANAETANLFKKATVQKDAAAQLAIAFQYEFGRGGLPVDKAESLNFYKLAANQNHPRAQFGLGYFYAVGTFGLPKNDVLAERYFRLSANQGLPAAQDYLGHFYATGRGGLKNDIEAAKWFKLAADQGDYNGLNNLGRFYESGRGGLPKDENEAAKLYRLAANLGNPSAQVKLASFYIDGRGGLNKDTSEALRLYRLAAEKGNKAAQEKVKELEGRLQADTAVIQN